ncbi:MAG: hypothetical protein ACK56W_03690 [Pirellula sp.]|jgi:hypothetical protein
MQTYTTSAIMPRPSEETLQAALAILTNNGFTIVNRNERTASLIGPGLNSTKQNALLGASKICLKLEGNQLGLEAELGGVESMQRFLNRFPLLLGLVLGILFCLIGGFVIGQQFGVGFGAPWAQGWKWMLVTFGFSMLPVTPWIFLSPWIGKMLRTRTQLALNALVTNAVQMTKHA